MKFHSNLVQNIALWTACCEVKFSLRVLQISGLQSLEAVRQLAETPIDALGHRVMGFLANHCRFYLSNSMKLLSPNQVFVLEPP